MPAVTFSFIQASLPLGRVSLTMSRNPLQKYKVGVSKDTTHEFCSLLRNAVLTLRLVYEHMYQSHLWLVIAWLEKKASKSLQNDHHRGEHLPLLASLSMHYPVSSQSTFMGTTGGGSHVKICWIVWHSISSQNFANQLERVSQAFPYSAVRSTFATKCVSPRSSLPTDRTDCSMTSQLFQRTPVTTVLTHEATCWTSTSGSTPQVFNLTAPILA